MACKSFLGRGLQQPYYFKHVRRKLSFLAVKSFVRLIFHRKMLLLRIKFLRHIIGTCFSRYRRNLYSVISISIYVLGTVGGDLCVLTELWCPSFTVKCPAEFAVEIYEASVLSCVRVYGAILYLYANYCISHAFYILKYINNN